MKGVASVPNGTECLTNGNVAEVAAYFPMAKLTMVIFPKEIVPIHYADGWRQFCKDDPTGANLRIGLWEALQSLWWWAMPLVGLALVVVVSGGIGLFSMGPHSPGTATAIFAFIALALMIGVLLMLGHQTGKADTILVRTKSDEEGSGVVRTVAHRRLIYWRDILQSTWAARIITIPMVVIHKLAVAGSYVVAVLLAVAYIAWLIG